MRIRKIVAINIILVILLPTVFFPINGTMEIPKVGDTKTESDVSRRNTKSSKHIYAPNLNTELKVEFKNGTSLLMSIDNDGKTKKILESSSQNPKTNNDNLIINKDKPKISIDPPQMSGGPVYATATCDHFNIYDGFYFFFVVETAWQERWDHDYLIAVEFLIILDSDTLFEYSDTFDWFWDAVYRVEVTVWDYSIPSSWGGRFYYGYCGGLDDDGVDLDPFDGASDWDDDSVQGFCTPIPVPIPPIFPPSEDPDFDMGVDYPEEGELPPWMAWKGQNYHMSFELTNTLDEVMYYAEDWEERQLAPSETDWQDFGDAPGTSPVEEPNLDYMPADSTLVVESPIINHNWEWFYYLLGEFEGVVEVLAPVPPLWFEFGEKERTYEYEFSIDQLDEYGNIIEADVNSITLQTTVRVHPSNIGIYHAAYSLSFVGFDLKLAGWALLLTPEPTGITKAVGLGLQAAGAAIQGVAKMMADSVKDPPDPEYNEIYIPRDIIYEYDVIDDPLVHATNDLIKDSINSLELSEAFDITSDRFETAKFLGDTDVMKLQAEANRIFSEDLNEKILDMTNSINELKNKAEEEGISLDKTAEEANEILDEITTNGFPQDLIDDLSQLGFTDEDFDLVENEITSITIEEDVTGQMIDDFISVDSKDLIESVEDVSNNQVYESYEADNKYKEMEWNRLIEAAEGVKFWAQRLKKISETDQGWANDFKIKLNRAIDNGQADLSSFRSTLIPRPGQLKSKLIEIRTGLETLDTLVTTEILRDTFTKSHFEQLSIMIDNFVELYINSKISYCDYITDEATTGSLITAINSYITLLDDLIFTSDTYSSSADQISDLAKNEKDLVITEATTADLNELIFLNSSAYLAIEEGNWDDARTYANSLIQKALDVLDYTSNYKYLKFLYSGREALRIIEEAIEFIISLEPILNNVEPGYTVEYILNIENTGTASDIYAITLMDNEFPGVIELTQNEIALEPGEIGQISIFVTPQRHYSTEPGIYDFTITVQSLGDILEIKEIQGKINVTAFHDIQIHVEPEFLEGYPGDQISYNIFVQNLGNIQESYTISFEGLDFNGAYEAYPTLIPNAWVDILPNVLTLNPAEIQTVEIIISIPLNWSGFEVSTYKFLAIATCDLDPNTEASSLGELAIKSTFTSSTYYVDWLLGEINEYIYSNSIVALYGVVTQKIVKIQNLVWEAYELIENGYLHTGLVRDKLAEIKLEIAESKVELMNNKLLVGEEHTEYILTLVHDARNKIIILMGLSDGTEFSYEISLVAVDVYKLRDFVEENILATDSENLVNAITLTAEKLEKVIFDISLDKSTEESLISAQNALDKARVEVVALARKGKISEELMSTLMIEIILIQAKIDLLIQF